MKAVYDWEAMLKDICKEKGWEEDKNCKISYEAMADAEADKLTFVAKIRPYAQIDEIEIKVVIE